MEKLLVSLKNGDKIKVTVEGEGVDTVVIGGKEKVIISGPCSVEDYSTMQKIGANLKKSGVNILRAGAFKPRTSPYDFQGLGMDGVKILYEVSREQRMPMITEIMDTKDIGSMMPYVDIFQIGSRNMYNYTLLKEIGRQNKPVLIKRGFSATLSEWMYAAEYVMSEGNHNVILCERGIRTFEKYTRNTLDLNAVAVIKKEFRIPVVVDPSHGTGLRELVRTMSLAGIAAGADGLMIESHVRPDNAISDARQTISIDTLNDIVNDINKFQSIF